MQKWLWFLKTRKNEEKKYLQKILLGTQQPERYMHNNEITIAQIMSNKTQNWFIKSFFEQQRRKKKARGRQQPQEKKWTESVKRFWKTTTTTTVVPSFLYTQTSSLFHFTIFVLLFLHFVCVCVFCEEQTWFRVVAILFSVSFTVSFFPKREKKSARI